MRAPERTLNLWRVNVRHSNEFELNSSNSSLLTSPSYLLPRFHTRKNVAHAGTTTGDDISVPTTLMDIPGRWVSTARIHTSTKYPPALTGPCLLTRPTTNSTQATSLTPRGTSSRLLSPATTWLKAESTTAAMVARLNIPSPLQSLPLQRPSPIAATTPPAAATTTHRHHHPDMARYTPPPADSPRPNTARQDPATSRKTPPRRRLRCCDRHVVATRCHRHVVATWCHRHLNRRRPTQQSPSRPSS
ncbi:hypothetical protein EDB85DRAFT_2152743 [Lactarius pseudohatsudake]|nr:hypothetical protein EDB85DRAFT_2152743 [Lactarius pseudohatsudake]